MSQVLCELAHCPMMTVRVKNILIGLS